MSTHSHDLHSTPPLLRVPCPPLSLRQDPRPAIQEGSSAHYGQERRNLPDEILGIVFPLCGEGAKRPDPRATRASEEPRTEREERLRKEGVGDTY